MDSGVLQAVRGPLRQGTLLGMVEVWHPELSRIHARFLLALQWSGLFLLGTILLPLGIDWDGTVWSWTVADHLSVVPALLAPPVAGLVLLGLSLTPRWSNLTKGIAATIVVAVSSWVVAADPDTGGSLLIGLPPQLKTHGWLLAIALSAAGAASAWGSGMHPLSRLDKPVRILVGTAWASTAVLLLWPTLGSPLLFTLSRSAWSIATAPSLAGIRSHLATNWVLGAQPLLVTVVVSVLALLRRRSYVRWVVGVPAVVTMMWGVKQATLGPLLAPIAGHDAMVGVALRAAVLFGVPVLVGIVSGEVLLAQLLDMDVPSNVAPAGLLRDALLTKVMAAHADIDEATRAFRPEVRRLLQERKESLLRSNRGRGDDPDIELCVRLCLRGVPQEEVNLLSIREVRLQLVAHPPRLENRVALFFAQGRRAEAAAIGVAVVAALVSPAASALRWLAPPRALEWTLAAPPEWASNLYEHLLPDMAIAAGDVATHEGREELTRLTEEAANEASPVPRLAVAIRELGQLAGESRLRPRAIAKEGARLNEAAREAHLPFYVDPNVMLIHNSSDIVRIYYVKTYKVVQARTATSGRASYGALWLDRLDKLNVAERRLGWRKAGAPYAMVILDVLRENWSYELWQRALIGQALPRQLLLASLQQDGMAPSDAEALLTEAMTCRDLIPSEEVAKAEDEGGPADEDDSAGSADTPPDPGPSPCALKRKELQTRSMAVLSRQIEGHELQHQIDGDRLAAPELVWRALGDEGDTVLRVSAELSAYLAEIVRAPLPKQALAHFASLSSDSDTPEAWAWEVAAPLLLGDRELHTVLESSDDELRQRAQDAHLAVFGTAVAQLEIRSSAGSSPRP